MSDDKQPNEPSSGQYGSGYSPYGGYQNYGGGYYYGYGYGGYGGEDAKPQRSLKDYLLIFRERIWYFIVTFFVIVTGTLLYTYNATEIFTSASTVRILRDGPRILGTQDIDRSSAVASAEDLNTQIRIMESGAVVSLVAGRLSDEERERFLAPYGDGFLTGPVSVEQVLSRNRRVSPVRMSMMVHIVYSHPDPDVAAMIANYFADEYINYNLRQNIDTSMRAVEDLRIRADQQRAKVEEIRARMVEFRERTGRTSLNPEENIERAELQRLQQINTEDRRTLDMVENQRETLEEYLDEGRPLTELPFLVEQSRISQLLDQRSNQRIAIETLRERYRDGHPRMIESLRAYEKTQEELDEAIATAIEKVRVGYRQAQQNFDVSTRRLAEKEAEILELNRLAVQYQSLQDELEVNNSLYQAMMLRLQSEMQQVALHGPNARIIDNAGPAISPSSPNHFRNMAVGIFGGIIAGLGLVFVTAFLDDRIKSAFDIESAVGLPLIGIIPRIKKLNSPEKAQAVANNSEKRVTEAFRAIHSALKINDLSKRAKVFLVTSTSPSEGKSFVTSNLALTFAIHGEKTMILDADLRMPNISKSLGIDEKNGLCQIFEDNMPLEQVVREELYPNLDVLTAGGKAKNPTQIFNNPRFEQLIAELGERYDRLLLDTPPVAAVSDALTLLPLCDGVLYVIKFNAVKKRTAKANLRRIIDSNAPVFGAVLNQISLSVASYYYSHYYDKKYESYYHQGDDGEALANKTVKAESAAEPKA